MGVVNRKGIQIVIPEPKRGSGDVDRVAKTEPAWCRKWISLILTRDFDEIQNRAACRNSLETGCSIFHSSFWMFWVGSPVTGYRTST